MELNLPQDHRLIILSLEATEEQLPTSLIKSTINLIRERGGYLSVGDWLTKMKHEDLIYADWLLNDGGTVEANRLQAYALTVMLSTSEGAYIDRDETLLDTVMSAKQKLNAFLAFELQKRDGSFKGEVPYRQMSLG